MNEQDKDVYGKKTESNYQGVKRKGSYRLSSGKGRGQLQTRPLATTLRNLLSRKAIWMQSVILWCAAHNQRQRQRQRGRANAQPNPSVTPTDGIHQPCC